MPTISYHHTPATKPTGDKKLTILDAPGVDVGQAVEWKVGNMPANLTDRNRTEIKKALGVRRIKEAKCLTIKRMMITKTCAQIVAYFKGRRGWSGSWITKVHAALSK